MRWKRLFWVLIVVSCMVLAFRLHQFYLRPKAAGFLLRIGDLNPPEDCEFRIPLVLHIAGNQTFRLNEEPVSGNQLPVRLDMILKERIQPILYIEGNQEMGVQEFAQILDLVRKTNDKIEVRIVTPGNRKQSCIDFRTGPAT